MRRHVLLFVVGLLLVGPVLATAKADSPATPETAGSSAVDRARAFMERGQELYLKGLFAEAAAQFEQAYGEQKFGAFLFNAGVAYEKGGDAVKAADLFQRYLDETPKAEDAEAVKTRIANLRAGVAAASAETQANMKSVVAVRTTPEGAKVTVYNGANVVESGVSPFGATLQEGAYKLVVEHPDYKTSEQQITVTQGVVYAYILEMSQGKYQGSLEVLSDVPGAEVYINDKTEGVRGKTPFQADLPPGTYKLWIARPGYREVEAQVEVELGRVVRFRADMTRVDFGRVRVIANVRGANVSIDGKLAGTAPGVFDVPSGSHVVTVAADEMKDWEQQIDVRRGKETPLRIRLRPSVDRSAGWVTGTLSVALLAGGIVLGVLAQSEKNSIQRDIDNGTLATNDGRLGKGFPDLGTGGWLALGADVAFGAAAILGGLAIYYFVRDPLPDSEGAVQEPRDWAFSPYMTPNGGGAAFVGSF